MFNELNITEAMAMTRDDLIIDLYKNAVDARDTEHLARFITDDAVFRIGNHDPIIGVKDVVSVNENFFHSIDSMNHTIDKILNEADYSVCYGTVRYVRLDGSKTSAVFATVLRFVGDKISEYYVYADLSEL